LSFIGITCLDISCTWFYHFSEEKVRNSTRGLTFCF